MWGTFCDSSSWLGSTPPQGSVNKFPGGARTITRSTTWKVFERENVVANLLIWSQEFWSKGQLLYWKVAWYRKGHNIPTYGHKNFYWVTSGKLSNMSLKLVAIASISSYAFALHCGSELGQGFSNFLFCIPNSKKAFMCDSFDGYPRAVDVNDTCERPNRNLERHFCVWWNNKNAHNSRKWLIKLSCSESTKAKK